MLQTLALGLLVLAAERPPGAWGKGSTLPPDVVVEKDIVYGKVDDIELKLDLYQAAKPTKKPRPAILYIHGGGWKGGDKREFAWYAGMLAQNGYAVATINYRLSGQAKYPAQIQDCQAALAWLEQNARRYRIDRNRIATMGGSAGGHLASLLALKEGKARIRAVVSVFGAHELNDDGGNQSAPEAFIGAARTEKLEQWKDAACTTHVSADDPPFLLIHGDKDATVPLSQSERLLKALLAKRVRAQLIVVRGAGHGFNDKVMSPGLAQIDQKVLAFLARYLP